MSLQYRGVLISEDWNRGVPFLYRGALISGSSFQVRGRIEGFQVSSFQGSGGGGLE